MKSSLFNLTIGKRISLGFAAVIALVIGFGIFSILQQGSIRKSSESITLNALPGVQIAGELDAIVKDQRANLLRHMSVKKSEDKAASELQIQKNIEKTDTLVKDYEKKISSEQDRALFNKFAEVRSAFHDHFQKTLELSRSNKTEEAEALYESTTRPAILAFSAAADDLKAFNEQTAAASTKEINATISRSLSGTIFSVSAAILVALAIALFVVRSITGPLGRALLLVQGVSDRDLTMSVQNDSSDEVGQMCRSLNQMVENLSGNIRTIGETSQSVAAASEELDAVSSQVSATSDQASRQATAVAAAAEQVSSNISTVATAAEEMGGTIKEIAKNASEAARIASQAVRAAEETNASVAKLGDSTLEIGNVIKVITSIAEQTNLLALNATIEAARAGEAGKGFAVVANEVKELAKQTAAATEDISKKIAAIQGDSKGAVDAIQKIGAIIDQINEMQTTIASAVEEQTAATSEIARNAAEAARGSGEITRSVAGVSEAVRTTTEAAGQTLTAAQELAQLAASLESVVKEFKIEANGSRGEPSRPPAAKAIKAPASSSRAGNGRALPQVASSSHAKNDPFVHGSGAHSRI